MSRTIQRFSLGIGAAAVVVAMTVAAGGVNAGAQNTSGQDPASGRAGPGPGRGRGPGGDGQLGGPGRRGGPGRQGGPRGPRGILGPIAIERLGLSESQQAQVSAVIQSHDAELKALHDRAFAARQALQATVTADAVDERAIRARSADVASIEADLAVIQARVRAQVFQLLTPEQRAKAKEMQPRPGDRRPPPA